MDNKPKLWQMDIFLDVKQALEAVDMFTVELYRRDNKFRGTFEFFIVAQPKYIRRVKPGVPFSPRSAVLFQAMPTLSPDMLKPGAVDDLNVVLEYIAGDCARSFVRAWMEHFPEIARAGDVYKMLSEIKDGTGEAIIERLVSVPKNMVKVDTP